MAVKNLIICADDFAQNANISQAILQLIAKKKLSATSCMTQSPYWPEFSIDLKPYTQKIDVGLHFNLTHPFSNNAVFSLPKLMLNQLTRQLSIENARRLLNQQLDLFEKHFDSAPAFIDGHQHVHQFYAIRQALIDTIEKRYPNHMPYVRTTVRAKASSFGIEPFKSAVIAFFGGKSLRKELDTHFIRHNADFGGIYNLLPNAAYQSHMQSWLKRCANNGLIMCHPGLNGNDEHDPIRFAREKEYHYFLSDAFENDLASAGVILTGKAKLPLN